MKDKRKILIGCVIGAILAVVLVATFFFGVLVGKRDYKFFPYWERRHTYPDFFPNKLSGHGVLGTIQTLGKSTLVVKDRTGALKTVLVDSRTRIRRERTDITISDLKINEQVVILGEPQESESAIKARIIRVMGALRNQAKGI